MIVKNLLEQSIQLETLFERERLSENPDPIKLYDIYNKWEWIISEYEMYRGMNFSDDDEIPQAPNKVIFPKF